MKLATPFFFVADLAALPVSIHPAAVAWQNLDY
jgi:hypothetical protein